ncbi:hypothetical protein RA993_23020, partial [Mycobacteroides abscessus subsp. abscessus]|uniref:hypothetical protein n=1 Tax=Mycobacteroides abscessus TaxID=36809 RepID=UPI003CF9181D
MSAESDRLRTLPPRIKTDGGCAAHHLRYDARGIESGGDTRQDDCRAPYTMGGKKQLTAAA